MQRTRFLCGSIALTLAALTFLRADTAQADSSPAELSQEGAKPAAGKLDQLAWLAGSWELEAKGAQTEEHWIAPKGGTMLGCGRTIARGKTVFFEFLRLEERADGELYYVAHPAGRSPGTDFKLTSSTESSWTFENPAHDFPRSIRYTRNADGSATAHLEGLEGGQLAVEDFHYRRPAK
jgi:hypothetical protein